MGFWKKVTGLFTDAAPEPELLPPAGRHPVSERFSPKPLDIPTPDNEPPRAEPSRTAPAYPASLGKTAAAIEPKSGAPRSAYGAVPSGAEPELGPHFPDAQSEAMIKLTEMMNKRMAQVGQAVAERKAGKINADAQALKAKPQGPRGPATSQPNRPPAGMDPRAPQRFPASAANGYGSQNIQTIQTGSYQSNEDSALFMMMFPEWGLIRNPTSMKAWTIWMLERDQHDHVFHGDGFTATVGPANASGVQGVQFATPDGAIENRAVAIDWSSNKMLAIGDQGVATTFDFGESLGKADDLRVTHDSGDGRSFDWSPSTGLSSAGVEGFDLGPSPSPIPVFDSGNSTSNSPPDSWSASSSPDGNRSTGDGIDLGPAPPNSNSGSWDSGSTPAPDTGSMSTAY
jgi:hypothetical protein